jgi:hypothetical protein
MTAASPAARALGDFAQAFDRDRAALGYAIEDADWWWSILPLSDLARAWDAWSRRLEPQTMPSLIAACGVLRGGGG